MSFSHNLVIFGWVNLTRRLRNEYFLHNKIHNLLINWCIISQWFSDNTIPCNATECYAVATPYNVTSALTALWFHVDDEATLRKTKTYEGIFFSATSGVGILFYNGCKINKLKPLYRMYWAVLNCRVTTKIFATNLFLTCLLAKQKVFISCWRRLAVCKSLNSSIFVAARQFSIVVDTGV